jgi:hypothetical protein
MVPLKNSVSPTAFSPKPELKLVGAVASAGPFLIMASAIAPDVDTIELTFESDDTGLYTIQRSTRLQLDRWIDV